VDKTNQQDSIWSTSVTNLLNSAGVTLIAAFPDCRQLKQMEKSGQFIAIKSYVSAATASIGKSSPEEVTQTCDELKTKTYSDVDKASQAKSIKEFSNGGSSVDSIALGVLEEIKGEVCYVATLQKVKPRQDGDVVTMRSLFAVTNARGDLIFLYQYTPYADATSIPAGLANLKIFYSNFAAANKH
jgi:hypothetical protein